MLGPRHGRCGHRAAALAQEDAERRRSRKTEKTRWPPGGAELPVNQVFIKRVWPLSLVPFCVLPCSLLSNFFGTTAATAGQKSERDSFGRQRDKVLPVTQDKLILTQESLNLM